MPTPSPRFVEIEFDCLPLRTVTRLDVPVDASPKFRQRCERIARAIQTHGTHNSYYLSNARCVFHLTNDPTLGMIEFRFEGTVLTDDRDLTTRRGDLEVELVRETCDWLVAPVVEWFRQSVERAVRCEFDRYIAAGDLQRTLARIESLQKQSDQQGGYLGMYL